MTAGRTSAERASAGPLRVLILENNPADAALLVAELKRFGYEVDWVCVDCEEAFLGALDPAIDIIIADYSMPQFDARRALELHQESGLSTPFIVVSGTVGEDKAVEAMQAGATDYLLKDRLARLGIAVQRARELRQTRTDRRRLAQAMEQTGEAVMITDAAGVLLYVNAAFEAITGYAQREVLGETLRLLDSGHHDTEFFRDMWQIISRGEVWRGRIVNRRRDGAEVQMDMAISPIRNRRGQIIEYVGVARDVTERVNLERAFFQAQKMEAVGRLAGGIAHDFNNLLTAILGYSDLLGNSHPDPKLARYAREIHQAAKRGAGLTRQLLTFSRQEPVWAERLDLGEVVRSIESLLGRVIGVDVHLELDLAGGVPAVEVDRGLMEQAIVNLVVNARDAMPEGGTIRLSTGTTTLTERTVAHGDLRAGRYARLAIRDDGVGMEASVRERIFEPFFTTKSADKGTGLGLSTTFGIIQKAGGLVQVESEPGQGACFTILLPEAAPASQAASPAAMPAVERPAEAPVEAQTILVVEDEIATGELIQRLLCRDGHRVLLAPSAEEALVVCRQHEQPIDLLLTDIVLPDKAGPQLAQEVGELLPDLAVVFMSGYPGDALDRMSLGDHVYLAKPFTTAGLREALQRALARDADEP